MEVGQTLQPSVAAMVILVQAACGHYGLYSIKLWQICCFNIFWVRKMQHFIKAFKDLSKLFGHKVLGRKDYMGPTEWQIHKAFSTFILCYVDVD